MRAYTALAAIALLTAAPAFAEEQSAQPSTPFKSDGENRLETALANLSATMKIKVVLYAEHGGDRFGILMVGQPHGSKQRIYLSDATGIDPVRAVNEALIAEFKAAGTNERPSVLLVADNGKVTVERRGSSPGPISGFPGRASAEVDRAIPEIR